MTDDEHTSHGEDGRSTEPNSHASAASSQPLELWETIDVTITVKAYPAVSSKYRETVCVAGIREGILGTGRHIRLFPVSFRHLPFDQRFKKWDRLRLRVRRPNADHRPESYSPDMSSAVNLGHLSSANKWAQRRPFVDQVPRVSMCELQALQIETDASLGLVDPGEVLEFTAELRPEDERAEAKRFLAEQPTLFDMDERDVPLVEAIPWMFRYKFRCADCSPGSAPHHQSIIDWELGAAYRNWRQSYGEDGIVERLRARWLDEICDPSRETLFFSGNMNRHPRSFLVLGCWWPAR